MKTIEKKILPKYFYEVAIGTKTFELRKDEDNVSKGDILILKEWDGSKFTGKTIEARVTYVLRNCSEYGLMDGYCIIGIENATTVDAVPVVRCKDCKWREDRDICPEPKPDKWFCADGERK